MDYQKYVHIYPESSVYARSGDTFTQTKGKAKKDIHKIMPQEKCHPFKDSNDKRWFDIGDIAARMVVKHDSEWFGGSSHHRWKTFLKQMDPLCVSYVKQWFDDMEWMSKVDGFSSGSPV